MPDLSDAALYAHLIELETTLHRPVVRQDAVKVGALLDDGFTEIGRSGRTWDKAAMLHELMAQRDAPTVYADEFRFKRLAPAIALLTYRSAALASDGTLSLHALRSSVWRQAGLGWQMVFHQGTPTAPFVANLPAG
ncbi:hypothetical protein HNQ50_003579 [Silvimonas terrae]|uniref:DUF4440 domain-containing protein n=1 Tax=Silvimonas terrae TaxID=300266 RepID=A0A840RHL8_9NEIS|nr:DUF4440 domain-containing protein [Silvimonas terrae]MBB5192825.1 hypothetical protein [Silvimonas terrae]